jgi:hypothetical protein
MFQASIVIVEAEGDKLSALYIGKNPTEAEAVFEMARLNEKHLSVSLIQNAHPRIVCHPATDAELRRNEERDRKQREERELAEHKERIKDRISKAKADLAKANADLKSLE